jgi:O-acetyl-ADP-ribose deacetylase (regulator of RNase III)/uncharacterized protein YwgA
MTKVRIVEGDLLKSRMHALVNTVNTVGVMGKGVALAFKKRYPDMFKDYAQRCARGEVKIGQPYPYAVADHIVVNFPTKEHWRAVSRISDIEAGLETLEKNYKVWGIRSIAVPPLGCGNGQLEWRLAAPVLLRHLERLDIPVELYAPHGSSMHERQTDLFTVDDGKSQDEIEYHVEPWLVGVGELIRRLEVQPYHWPVGRVMLQKIVYFATMAGLPTGLNFEAASYGPFAQGLKAAVARMQNNGLLLERRRGNMFEVVPGRHFNDARVSYKNYLDGWREILDRTFDLVVRFDTKTAEVAASVHYVSEALRKRLDRPPTITEVINAVEAWKIRRQPPLSRDDILQAIVNLGMRGWLEVQADAETETEVEDLVLLGAPGRQQAHVAEN